MTAALDQPPTDSQPAAPFPLIRTAGPLPLSEARLLTALTERLAEIETLLQDQPYWDSYAARSDRFAARDHQANLIDQATELRRRIYQLQNPGAPAVQEQAKARAAAIKAAQETAAAKKPSPLRLLGLALALAGMSAGVLLGGAAGMGLLIHVYESNVMQPASGLNR